MKQFFKNFLFTIIFILTLPLVIGSAVAVNKNILPQTEQNQTGENLDEGQNGAGEIDELIDDAEREDEQDGIDEEEQSGQTDGDEQDEQDSEDGGQNEQPKEEQSKPVAVEPAETFYTDMYVASKVNLNVRSAPSTSGAVVGQLLPEDSAQLISHIDTGWYKIIYKGKTAYISASASYTVKVTNTDYRVIADRIIAEGLKILGTPYEFGAQRLLLGGKLNPKFTGNTFDCSSFVQYIFYKGAGIKLNEDSRSQSIQGTQVNKANLRKGDLLFMYSTARQYNTGIERIGHVALYIGNNRILHTFGTGGVRIQEYSDFWQGRTLKIMRMF